MRRVVVTGTGLVTPLGRGSSSVWKRLLNGDSGIGPVTRFDPSKYKGLKVNTAAQVPDDVMTGISPSELAMMPRFVQYAVMAADDALTQAGWDKTTASDIQKSRFGVAVGTGIGDLEGVVDGSHKLADAYRKLSPYFVPRVLQNMAAGHISIRHELRGPNHCVVTACATGAHSIGDAYRFIRDGYVDSMVCGGTEASIHPLAFAGFNRCKALSSTGVSRPFDAQRDGFIMGEGAGVMILEELTTALERGAEILGEIRGYGLTGDGYHITSPEPSGDGAYRSMRMAMDHAGVDSVDYVNAHATSTPLGDKVEAKAISRAMLGKKIAISSTKGAMGHLLGAAGSVEAIFTVLALYHQIAPATLNLERSDIETPCNFITNQPLQASPGSLQTGLTNSFGFGGTNASLVFSRWEG